MALTQDRTLNHILSETTRDRLFPQHLELVPQLNEVYELELAYLESRILDDDEIIRNGAYFARVGDRLTRHFLMCSGESVLLPQNSSSRLRSFFQTNQFKTGYGTHGLFPYRGKFHPQMIKGLMNVMGLKPGEAVLDPMMGSGTVLIEASLMGINSFGVDTSPFCRFMTQAKLDGLKVPLEPLREAQRKSRIVFDHFCQVAGAPRRGSKKRAWAQSGDLLELMESGVEYVGGRSGMTSLPRELRAPNLSNFLLLAYLDSAGYSERSSRATPYDQFRAILDRYVFVAEKVQRVIRGLEEELGVGEAIEGDARELPFSDESVDGIIFSPPYSFAIDYLENDSFHLRFMGVDVDDLRQKMIGLRGDRARSRVELYRQDMERVMSECARVLRRGRICTVVVGTNNNQLAKVMGVAPSEVEGIDDMHVTLSGQYGLSLVRRIVRQITGMANVMRNESILMFTRS